MKRSILLMVALSIGTIVSYAQDTTQHIVAGRENDASQVDKPYVILISVDGMRYDLAKRFNARNILRLAAGGVTARYMRPSFPSLTFPNHYTLVTGLYPAHHGLVNNSFYDKASNSSYSMSNKSAVADSSWYGGTPLWSLAEMNHLLTASYFWVASESNIKGWRPTYYYLYNEKVSIDTRLKAVEEWLQLPAAKRPHLITFYFPEVDHAEHEFSVSAPETAAAIRFVDRSIARMVELVNSVHLPVNFIVVSDHGMTDVNLSRAIAMPAAIDTSKFIIPGGSTLIHLYARDSSVIASTYAALKKEAKDYDVYYPNELPAHWHFSKSDDRYDRVGDILLVPRYPAFFNFGRKLGTGTGRHGFDPYFKDMRASFYAWGPSFKKGITIPGFENVNIFPMIARLLGLRYDFPIDGDAKVLAPIFK